MAKTDILGLRLSCAQSMIVARGALTMSLEAAREEVEAAEGLPRIARHWSKVAERLEGLIAALDAANDLRRMSAERAEADGLYA